MVIELWAFQCLVPFCLFFVELAMELSSRARRTNVWLKLLVI